MAQATGNRRTALRQYEDKRLTMIGIFQQLIADDRHGLPRCCIMDVHKASDKTFLCGHIWVDGLPFLDLGIKNGDYVKFTCKVHRKHGRWFVTWPTRVKKLPNGI